jgi:Fic family protein
MNTPYSQDYCLSHHHGNPESLAAHERVLKHKDTLLAKVYELAIEQKRYGITKADVMKKLGLSHPTATARLTELKAAKLLVESNQRRDNCRVLVLVLECDQLELFSETIQ